MRVDGRLLDHLGEPRLADVWSPSALRLVGLMRSRTFLSHRRTSSSYSTKALDAARRIVLQSLTHSAAPRDIVAGRYDAGTHLGSPINLSRARSDRGPISRTRGPARSKNQCTRR